MKNILINDFGVTLGVKSAILVVKKEKSIIKEIPLNRIKTIHIFSKGVSISSNLIMESSARGIKIFFVNNNNFSAISTLCEHKSVSVRKNQFKISNSKKGIELARKIIIGKIKNQKSTVLYSSRNINNIKKLETIEFLENSINKLKNKVDITKDFILGIEGSCANKYFEFLKYTNLLPKSFTTRTKRNSKEITNISLNYGYAILFNFLYKSILNAGLEPFSGVLHEDRSAKPALVLDIMEEYRSFVIDRNIIKLRFQIENASSFESIKKNIAKNVLSTFSRKYTYNKKKLTLESIIQRQIYKISAYFSGRENYKSYIFRW